MCEFKTRASSRSIYCFVGPQGTNDTIHEIVEAYAAEYNANVSVLRSTPVGLLVCMHQKDAYDITSIIASRLGSEAICYEMSSGVVYEAYQ